MPFMITPADAEAAEAAAPPADAAAADQPTETTDEA
jgi:hypothetical protein